VGADIILQNTPRIHTQCEDRSKILSVPQNVVMNLKNEVMEEKEAVGV
jgi:hypothetical protein